MSKNIFIRAYGRFSIEELQQVLRPLKTAKKGKDVDAFIAEATDGTTLWCIGVRKGRLEALWSQPLADSRGCKAITDSIRDVDETDQVSLGRQWVAEQVKGEHVDVTQLLGDTSKQVSDELHRLFRRQARRSRESSPGQAFGRKAWEEFQQNFSGSFNIFAPWRLLASDCPLAKALSKPRRPSRNGKKRNGKKRPSDYIQKSLEKQLDGKPADEQKKLLDKRQREEDLAWAARRKEQVAEAKSSKGLVDLNEVPVETKQEESVHA